MNLHLAFVGGLALSAYCQAATGQPAPVPTQTAPAAAPRNPSPSQAKAIKARTAERRAATYTGPRVVKDSKALGREFIQESKPVTKPVAPAKQ